MEATFRQIESLLASHENWPALRDFYIRFCERYQLHTPLRKEAQQKALLLSLHVAPHPTHALQLLIDSQQQDPPSLPTMYHTWAIQRLLEHGWLQQLHTYQQHTQHKHDLPTTPLHNHPDTQSNTEWALPDDPDDLLHTIQQQQREAAQETDPYEQRKKQLRIALLLSSSHDSHDTAATYWHEILSQSISDPIVWHQLYELTIPSQRWELLSLILQQFDPRDVVFPTSTRLRLPLLQALEQDLFPGLDPLPLLIHAFQQAPGDHRRFQVLTTILRQRNGWSLLRRVTCVHLAHQQSTQPSHNHQRFHSHAYLLSLLHSLQQAPNVPPDDIFSTYLQAIAFSPKEDGLLSSLLHWSRTQPATHNVHHILALLALEGRGSVSFRMRIAQTLSAIPHSQEEAAQLYRDILEQHPKHIDALQAYRQLSIMRADFREALATIDQEMALQHEPIKITQLLQHKAQLLYWHLQQPEDALLACQEAIRIMPHNLPALQMMAEILEQLHQPKLLLPVLAQLIMPTEHPETKRYYLQKMLRYALHPLQDYKTALRTIRDLLTFPNTTATCVNAFEQLVHIPQAQMPLLSFLLEREEECKEPFYSQIKLIIIQLLFRQLRFQEARTRLQRFLQHANSSLPLLQETEAITVQHHAWNELATALKQQIQLLLTNPQTNAPIATLYIQLGDLYEQLLDDPNQAQEAYRKALIFDPKDADARERLEAMLHKQGGHAECRDLLASQARQLPRRQGAEALVRAALIAYHNQRDTETATKLLQEALQRNPHHPRANELYLQLQRDDKGTTQGT
jgi:tetratricopeptide (TPR) repeat protein